MDILHLFEIEYGAAMDSSGIIGMSAPAILTISSDYSPNVNKFRFCQIGIWNLLRICPFVVVVCQEILFL
jgi:hypothetical protein